MVSKQIFTDQLNRQVEVLFPPTRIISLVPSQTELLYDLGLNSEVVGQTIFCVHPSNWHATKPRVGGTKNYKMDSIAALKPDLIIGNKEENDKAGIEELAQLYPVWMSDIQTLDDSIDMILKIGLLVNRTKKAQEIAVNIQQSFNNINPISQTNSVNCIYLIWRKPYMAAGHHTFINDMLNRLGLQNVATNQTSRYPEITADKLQSLNPQLILLSSEPYPFKQKHIDELKEICPQATVLLVDGELFSWYGSRLLHSAAYFIELLKAIAK